MAAGDILARIEAGLGRQEELLRELRALGERQLSLVRENDLPGLEGTLARKRELQGALEREERELAPLWERLGAGEEAREALAARMGALEALLHEVRGLEEEAARSLGGRLQEVRDELQSLSRGGRALRTYAPRASPPPRFIDTER